MAHYKVKTTVWQTIIGQYIGFAFIVKRLQYQNTNKCVVIRHDAEGPGRGVTESLGKEIGLATPSIVSFQHTNMVAEVHPKNGVKTRQLRERERERGNYTIQSMIYSLAIYLEQKELMLQTSHRAFTGWIQKPAKMPIPGHP